MSLVKFLLNNHYQFILLDEKIFNFNVENRSTCVNIDRLFKITYNNIPKDNHVTKIKFYGSMRYNNMFIEKNSIDKRITHVIMYRSFDQPLDGLFKEGIRYINLHDALFNNPLNKGDFPSTLTHLILNSLFNNFIEPDVIKDGLIYIKFGYQFNKPLKPNAIPKTTKYVIFGNSFNQELFIDVIPKGAIYVDLGNDFDKLLKEGNLQVGLKTLIFSTHYNHPLENGVIPKGTQKVVFGLYFNQPLKPNDIPIGTIMVSFEKNKSGSYFNQPLKPDDIPYGTKILILGSGFNRPLEKGSIPDSVVYLEIDSYSFNHELNENNLPRDLEILVLKDTYDLSRLRNREENPFQVVIYRMPDNSDGTYIFLNTNMRLCINGCFNDPLLNGLYVNKEYFDKYAKKTKSKNAYRDQPNNIQMTHVEKDMFTNYLFNKIIFNNSVLKELNEKIIDPNRMERMAKIYNCKSHELFEIYVISRMV